MREIDHEAARLVGLLKFICEGDGVRINSPLGSTDVVRLEDVLAAPLAGLREEIGSFFSRRTDATNPWPAVAVWQKAATELRSNAAAPLPA